MFRSFFCVCVRQVFVAFTIMVSPLWVGNRIVCGVKILIFVPGLFGSSGLSTTWNDQSLFAQLFFRLSCNAFTKDGYDEDNLG